MTDNKPVDDGGAAFPRADDRIQAVADSIVVLTYGELMEVAASLRDIHLDRAVEGSEFEDAEWASLLHAWADNYDGGDAS